MALRPDRGTWSERRPVVAVAGLLVAVLVALLVVDLVRLPSTWAFPRPIRATRFVDVAATAGRARMVNIVVGMAAREQAGSGVTIVVPLDVGELLDVEADVFGGREQATLGEDLIAPLVAGRVRAEEYDPVLGEAEAAAIEGDNAAVAYPLDVWAVPPAEEARSGDDTDAAGRGATRAPGGR